MSKLLIVESPTKAKTITKFLGKDYKVLSSFGHVRDLPKSKLGVDTEHDFEPDYVIPTKAKKAVTELKKAAKEADEVVIFNMKMARFLVSAGFCLSGEADICDLGV